MNFECILYLKFPKDKNIIVLLSIAYLVLNFRYKRVLDAGTHRQQLTFILTDGDR